MIASIRTTFHFWLRAALYGTLPGSLARRLRARLRRGGAAHERSDYWDGEIHRLYRRPNLNGRVSGALRHATTAALLRTCGPAARSVLDVGCAYGELADALVDIGVQRYVGVDLSDEGIAAARREAPHRPAAAQCSLEFHCADLRAFDPPERDRFDLIVFSEVLKYLDVAEAERQVGRYAQWLAPEGVLCVVLTDDPKCHAIFRKLAARYHWVYGAVYQQLPHGPRFRLTADRANPGYLVGLFRPPGDRTDDERVR